MNREANLSRHGDLRLLGYIRRVNLDGMWSSAVTTVSNNLNNLRKNIKAMEELGVPINLPSISPWPLLDASGFTQALAELKASQGKGSYHTTYQQYETIRKMRSSITNLHQSTVTAAESHLALIGVKQGPFQLSCRRQDFSIAYMWVGVGFCIIWELA